LPAVLLEDCMDPTHLPKLEKSEGVTMLLVRAYDERSDSREDGVQSMTRKLVLFIGEHFLVAVHRQELPFLTAALAEIRAQKEEVRLQLVMRDILLAAAETFHKPIESAENRIHEYEKKMLRTPNANHDWEDIFVTKSRLMVIKRMLWHILNSVQKFVPHTNANLSEFQDLRERLESLHFFADSLLDNLNSLLNIQISLASNGTNEVMRVLTIYSVVFMPLNLIVGIYGMNFEHMPELKSTYGYPAVLTLIVVTALSSFLWFRKKGWIKPSMK
jgi:magnesium transporter